MGRQTVWGILAGFALLIGLAQAKNPPKGAPAAAQPRAQAPADASSGYDPQLAQSVGADAIGMRHYVMVILKSGTSRTTDGAQRDTMYKAHFATIARLAQEGVLAFAGPFEGDNWRGMLLLAVPDIEQARQLLAADPVLVNGEMVAEYHKYYGSGALMLVTVVHPRLVKGAQ